MIKGFRFFTVFLFTLIFLSSANAQSTTAKKNFNPLVKPDAIVKKLSYDNFKRIKLLYTAIMNYGGGKAEFDRIVDIYAEASALYFQNKLIESANLFTKNKKDIDKVASKIAQKYKEATEKLHTNIIKMHVRYNIKMSIKGEKLNHHSEVAISSASFGVQKANDFYVRSRHVNAIFYFRRAKDSCFQVYKVLEVPLPEEFKKDLIDNRNKIYVSKHKKI